MKKVKLQMAGIVEFWRKKTYTEEEIPEGGRAGKNRPPLFGRSTMKHGRIWAAVLACTLLFTGCAGGGDTSANAPSTPMEEAFAGRDMTLSVRLMAVGDNLIHDVIYQQAAAQQLAQWQTYANDYLGDATVQIYTLRS